MAIFKDIVPDEAKRGYEALPVQVKSFLSFEQFTLLFTQFVEARQPEMMKGVQAMTPAFTQRFHQRLDTLLGALCLSEVDDNILMWAHYAGSQTGYVLEFDAQHAHFHEQRSVQDDFRHLRRVRYEDGRPSARFSELDTDTLLLVKSSHWMYEKEWRIFRAFADAHAVFPASPYPIHLFDFPRETVTSVILGARMAPETEAKIRTVLGAHPQYKNVMLKRIQIDDAQFSMRVTPQA